MPCDAMCAESTNVQQVPAATGLTLRVINNVVKKMDVKSKFYEAFRKDGYPATFEYKQKVSHLLPQQQKHPTSNIQAGIAVFTVAVGQTLIPLHAKAWVRVARVEQRKTN